MRKGDLVRWRVETSHFSFSRLEKDIGIILEIQLTKERDFRGDDSILVMWPDGAEWIWRKELRKINESR